MKSSSFTTQQKQDIQWHLKTFVESFTSQRRASEALDNCSEATIISMLNESKWSDVSDAMWLNVGKQIGAFKRRSKLVETQDFQTLTLYYSLAKEEGATFAITGGAGSGKTYAGKWYAEANRKRSVFYLECASYWNKKHFLGNLCQALGKNAAGLSIPEMMDTIVRELSRLNQPLIILDEIDKLSDNVLIFYITLYNELNGLCGFVLQSTNQMQKRMMKGLRSNKTGFQELFSRIGSKFIELHGSTPAEVREMCVENGINQEEDIRAIINEYQGDLRRVERQLLKHSAKQFRNKQKSLAA
jgi:DNA transposition AAA+ family ATPase